MALVSLVPAQVTKLFDTLRPTLPERPSNFEMDGADCWVSLVVTLEKVEEPRHATKSHVAARGSSNDTVERKSHSLKRRMVPLTLNFF